MPGYKVSNLYQALTPNCETSSFFFITMNLMLSPEHIASGSSQLVSLVRFEFYGQVIFSERGQDL